MYRRPGQRPAHPMLKKTVSTIIIVFWLVMLGLLVRRTYLQPTAFITSDAVSREGVQATDEWFGIYQKGAKVGYSHTSVRPETETYRIDEESEIDLLTLGTVQHVKTVITSYTTRTFRLKYFDFSLQSEATSMHIKGAVVRKKLILDITTAGTTRTEKIPLTETPTLSPNITPALLLLGLEPGRTYRFPLFNPATLSTEEATVTVESKERLKVVDTEQTVYKLRESFQGMETTSWITQDGKTLKEISPLGFTLLRETPAEARKRGPGGPLVDITSLTMIPAGPIVDSAKVTSLHVRLTGVDLTGYDLDGGGQTLTGDMLAVNRAAQLTSYRLPYRGKEEVAFLRPTPLIQSDDPRIIAQTERILNGEHDAVAAARKLNEWVYTAVEKKPVVSMPSALEVLQQLEGDCNEHTALFTALARAAGIPTRMAAGIVYLDNGFYYHAWPEVWLGKWTAVDPTFGQFPADATHIRFVIGNLERQSAIMRLIGHLKVKVLSAH